MLIKTSKSPRHNQNEYKNDNYRQNTQIFKQVVNLTKQNQFLKSQVQCLKNQLDKIGISKKKYKNKYIKLKVAQNKKIQVHRNQTVSNRRQNSGKIYRQNAKILSFSPINKNESNYDIPSTRSDLNRVVSEPRLIESRNKFIQIDQDLNPYNLQQNRVQLYQKNKQSQDHQKQKNHKIKDVVLQRAKNTDNQQYVLKINIGVKQISKVLQNTLKVIDKKCSDYQLFTNRIQGLQKQLNKIISQIKQNFTKILNDNHNHNHISNQKQKIIYINNNQINSPDLQDQYLISQNINIQKEIMSNEEQDELAQFINSSGKQELIRNNLKHNKRETNSRNHKSLNSHQNLLRNKIQNKKQKNTMQNEQCQQIQLKNSNSKGESWQILNQIGMELKNWRFSYDSSVLADQNYQNKVVS